MIRNMLFFSHCDFKQRAISNAGNVITIDLPIQKYFLIGVI